MSSVNRNSCFPLFPVFVVSIILCLIALARTFSPVLIRVMRADILDLLPSLERKHSAFHN